MTRQSQEAIRERSHCPSCASVDFQLILQESYTSPALKGFIERQYEGRADVARLTGFSYELVRCQDCGLAYQRTIPADDLLNEIYEEWIPPSEKDRLHRERELSDYRYMAEQIQFVVQHFNKRPFDLRVLDFGMGWAEWASMAKAFGCQVAGAELSSHRIQYARSIGVEVVSWEDISSRKFHFINTEQVFEHLIDPIPVLQHLANALEENGILRISVPNSAAPLRRLKKHPTFAALSAKNVGPVAPLEHVNCFEYRSLVALGAKLGLTPIRPSLRLLYNSSSGWLSFASALKLTLRPIYRHIFPKSTVVYFARSPSN